MKYCIFLGPYRNLTTLWASILSLHPDVQVCNHVPALLENADYNFIKDFSLERVENFAKFALKSSQSIEWSSKSGSIMIDHAYKQNKKFAELYKQRFGNNLVKNNIKCLVWKESGKVTAQLNKKSLDKMLETGIFKFFRPVRNPLDCAQSGIDKGYDFLVKDRTHEGRILGLLKDLQWFLEQEKQHPEKFLHLYENESNFIKLAKFLQIEPDKQWIKDASEVYTINQDLYNHSEEFVSIYKKLVSSMFTGYNKDKLLEYICGK